jgi:hypothetical protein
METLAAAVRQEWWIGHSHRPAEEELEGNRLYEQDKKTSAEEEREDRKRKRKRK